MSRRLILHIVVAVLSWLLFGYYWFLVSQRRITVQTRDSVLLLALLAVAIWAVTLLWIQHNRRTFGGRPDRRQRRKAPDALPEVDALGQPVHAPDAGALAAAAYVEISIRVPKHADGTPPSKTFRVADPPATGQGGAA